MNKSHRAGFKPFISQLNKTRPTGPQFTFAHASTVLDAFDSEVTAKIVVGKRAKRMNVTGLAGFLNREVNGKSIQMVAAPQVAVAYQGFFLTRIWLTELKGTAITPDLIELWKQEGFITKPIIRHRVSEDGAVIVDMITKAPFYQLVSHTPKTSVY